MTEYAYNGWPVIVKPAPGQLVPLAVRGESFAPGVLAGDVHAVFQELVDFLDAFVEPVDLGHPADDWGWNYRPNRNDPQWISTHGPATAIDYNATRHPNGKRGTWTKEQAAKVRAFLRDWLEGVVQWGEDYVAGVVDGMHFEIIKGRADVARVARKIELARAAVAALAQRPRSGAAVTILEEDMPTVLAAAGRPPVLVIGGLFVELRTEAEQINAVNAYNGHVLDDKGRPAPVWVEPGTLTDLIAQSQQAVRGGS